MLALLALVAPAAPAAAGEGHGVDLFGGYSFAKIDDVNRHGANAALGFDLFGPVDGFVDASAHWGSLESTSLEDLTLMAGPGVRFGKRGGTVFFVRALAGLVRARASITVLDVDISESQGGFGLLTGGGVDVPITKALAGLVRDRASISVLDVDISESQSRFGVLAGGGVDVPVARQLALRAQGGWLWNDVPEGSKASGLRASAGIVWRFGTMP